MIFSKDLLKLGIVYRFSNADETLTAELSFGETISRTKEFKIYFNGTFVHMSKTFYPAVDKAEALIREYSLIEPETEDITDIKNLVTILKNLNRSGLFEICFERKSVFCHPEDLKIVKPVQRIFISKLCDNYGWKLQNKSDY